MLTRLGWVGWPRTPPAGCRAGVSGWGFSLESWTSRALRVGAGSWGLEVRVGGTVASGE